MGKSSSDRIIRQALRVLVVSLLAYLVVMPLWWTLAPYYSKGMCVVANLLLARNPINGEELKYSYEQGFIRCDYDGRIQLRNGEVTGIRGTVRSRQHQIEFGLPLWLVFMLATPFKSFRRRAETFAPGLAIVLAVQLGLIMLFAFTGRLAAIDKWANPVDLRLDGMELYVLRWVHNLPEGLVAALSALFAWLLVGLPQLTATIDQQTNQQKPLMP
jgi:hypothetical protein